MYLIQKTLANAFSYHQHEALIDYCNTIQNKKNDPQLKTMWLPQRIPVFLHLMAMGTALVKEIEKNGLGKISLSPFNSKANTTIVHKDESEGKKRDKGFHWLLEHNSEQKKLSTTKNRLPSL